MRDRPGQRLILRLIRPVNLGIYVATFAAAAMVAAMVRPVVDPDGWWVAAAGRETIVHRAIPTTNLFSYVDATRPWIMHEWLLGPLYATAVRALGPSGFVALTLVVATLAISLVLAGTVCRARLVSSGLALAFVAIAFFGGRFVLARPTGVALLFPLALAFVAFAPRFGAASIVLVTGIEALWANAHGSFPLGIGIAALAAFDAKTDRAARFAATGAAALATCANPHGLELHRFVWHYLAGDEGIFREIHANIIEYGDISRAWGHNIFAADLAGIVVAAALAVAALSSPRHRLRAAFCLALLAAGLRQSRHIEIAGLLTCVLLVPFVDERLARLLPTEVPPTRAGRRRAVALIVAPPFLLGALVFAFLEARRAAEDWVENGAALLPLLAAVPDGARLYTPFGQAGLAIWFTFPRGVRVFYDSRNDCYSAETYRAFRSLEDSSTPIAVIRSVLARTATDTALVARDDVLAGFLSGELGWARIAEAGRFLLYRAAPQSVRP